MTRLWAELRAPEFSDLSPKTIAILPVALATTVYNVGGCASTYLTERGHNSFCWPWSTARLTQEMSTFNADDYTVTAQPAEPLQDGQPEEGIAVLG